jgi:uncharacterized repeat protein (TIGR03803 family)
MSDMHSSSKRIGLRCFLFVTVAGLLGARPAQAQTETVLYSFCSMPNCIDGSAPVGNLVLDPQGNVYGTTLDGGDQESGIVFEVTSGGTETVLHSLGRYAGAYGEGGLIRDAKGNLYGTTEGSSYFGLLGSKYFGSVFKLEKQNLQYLYRFTDKNVANGAVPTSGLVKDALGNLYGTAQYGGSGSCAGYGCGTVFKVTPKGTQTVLYNFLGKTDGEAPNGGLLLDSAGNLYGTTDFGGGGGTGCGQAAYCGTVFKVAPDGTEKILYSFAGGADGGRPLAGLVMDAEGNLYGTTLEGGTSSHCSDGCGTVFKVTPDGTETVLHSFGESTDGISPTSGLVMDGQGTLYGTTRDGGDLGCQAGGGCGTVFKVTPDATETVLYRFTGGTDGATPYGGLVLDGQGNLYGTTVAGGVGPCDNYQDLPGCGVVFKVTP